MLTPVRAAVIFGVLGALLVSAALSIPPFRNIERFHAESMNLAEEVQALASGASAHPISERYWKLREAHLTNRFDFEDRGLTLLELSLLFVLIRFIGKRDSWSALTEVRLPRKRWPLYLLGASAAIAAPVAFVLDLLQEFEREAYPSWADSLGIPLMSVPPIFLISGALSAFISLSVLPGYSFGARVAGAFSRRTRPRIWLVLLLGIPMFTAVCAAVAALILGSPISFFVSTLWLVFIVLCYAGRQQQVQQNLTGSPLTSL